MAMTFEADAIDWAVAADRWTLAALSGADEDPRQRAAVEVALELDVLDVEALSDLVRAALRTEASLDAHVRRPALGALGARFRSSAWLRAIGRAAPPTRTLATDYGDAAAAAVLDAFVAGFYDRDDRVGTRVAWALGSRLGWEARALSLVEAAEVGGPEARRRAMVSRAAWAVTVDEPSIFPDLAGVASEEHAFGTLLRGLEFGATTLPDWLLTSLVTGVAKSRSRVVHASFARLSAVPAVAGRLASIGAERVNPVDPGDDPLARYLLGPRTAHAEHAFSAAAHVRAALVSGVRGVPELVNGLLGWCEREVRVLDRAADVEVALDELLVRSPLLRDVVLAHAPDAKAAVAGAKRFRTLVQSLAEQRVGRIAGLADAANVDVAASSLRGLASALDALPVPADGRSAEAEALGNQVRDAAIELVASIGASDRVPGSRGSARRLARPLALAYAAAACRTPPLTDLGPLASRLFALPPYVFDFVRDAVELVPDEADAALFGAIHRFGSGKKAKAGDGERLEELRQRLEELRSELGGVIPSSPLAAAVLDLEVAVRALSEAVATGEVRELATRVEAGLGSVAALVAARAESLPVAMATRSLLDVTGLVAAPVEGRKRTAWALERLTNVLEQWPGPPILVQELATLPGVVLAAMQGKEKRAKQRTLAKTKAPTLGGFEVVAELGAREESGMGRCVLVRRPGTSDELRVLKTPNDRALVGMFREEAKALLSLAAVDHPNIVRFASFLDDPSPGSVPMLLMQYVPGRNLARRIELGGVAFDEGARCIARIADALAVAHGVGVAHLDLKPANVVLRGDSLADPVLVDWGLAGADPTYGTLGYMSPERRYARRSAEYRHARAWASGADVFALGIVALELFTGLNAVLAPLAPGESPPEWENLAARLEVEFRMQCQIDHLFGSSAVWNARVARLSAGLPEAWQRLLVACTELTNEARPSARAVASALGV